LVFQSIGDSYNDVFFILVIVSLVLRFTSSDYPFGVFMQRTNIYKQYTCIDR